MHKRCPLTLEIRSVSIGHFANQAELSLERSIVTKEPWLLQPCIKKLKRGEQGQRATPLHRENGREALEIVQPGEIFRGNLIQSRTTALCIMHGPKSWQLSNWFFFPCAINRMSSLYGGTKAQKQSSVVFRNRVLNQQGRNVL